MLTVLVVVYLHVVFMHSDFNVMLETCTIAIGICPYSFMHVGGET